MKTVDEVRRECIGLGSSLWKSDEAEAQAVSKIQLRADKTAPGDQAAIDEMAKDLEPLTAKIDALVESRKPPKTK